MNRISLCNWPLRPWHVFSPFVGLFGKYFHVSKVNNAMILLDFPRREVKNLGFRNLTEFTLGESSLCAVESVAANHALKGIGKIVS